MLRFRKYRVFFICAVTITFVLLQLSRNSRWESDETPVFKKTFFGHTSNSPSRHDSDQTPLRATAARPPTDLAAEAGVGPAFRGEVKIPQLKTASTETKGAYAVPPPTQMPPTTTTTTTTTGTISSGSGTTLQNPLAQTTEATSVVDAGLVKAPANAPAASAVKSGQNKQPPISPTAHWQKQTEWFPVPTESLIKLPKGKPKSMPKVQGSFEKESAEAKDKREARRDKVKAEAIRAWTGYKTYAWTHDELMPVSQKFKDPFCGWAATLVDSLDTLWIMGLKDEFNIAIEAVKGMDFTRTPFRSDIPVFETTIRYLGGLLAAFDVTGGAKGGYPILLDKATELAEVLMGAFDTPNRMPLLYYAWVTTATARPRRAGVSSMAELGSLGMEFTRLAQLTGNDKYYDAIARITDALEDFQNRGTSVPGLFPEKIDSSGCQKTANTLQPASHGAKLQFQKASNLGSEPQGRMPPGTAAGGDPKSAATGGKNDLEFTIRRADAGGSSAKGEFRALTKRGAQEQVSKGGGPPGPPGPPGSSPAVPVFPPIMEMSPLRANALPANWDCLPQGLMSGNPGSESFGMGGSQDSAYEYLPKLFILLGGLEPKYRTMYEKVKEGVKKYLLYRPLIEDESRDLLFSSKVMASMSNPGVVVHEYEFTHLTCFLGGMFGLGGRLFGSEEDVDIGKRLTEGCVWAYETSPSGIMAEHSKVVPCEHAENCPWNVTRWHQALDPNSGWRDITVQQYQLRKAEYDREMIEYKKLEAQWKEAKAKAAEQAEREGEGEKEKEKETEKEKAAATPTNNSGNDVVDTANAQQPSVSELRFRAKMMDPKVPLDPKQQKRAAIPVETGLQGSDGTVQLQLDQKVKKLEAELNLNSAGPSTAQQVPLPLRLPDPPSPPLPPPSHEEYVQTRIKTENLVPGFVEYVDKKYILRPEAIESVWYMYRITGDPIWQEKGWRMFEAIIAATQVPAGHSAIDDVTATAPPYLKTDRMESFWLAETLKYFYLLFETPDVISLDDWVLNTEAHPFRRPR